MDDTTNERITAIADHTLRHFAETADRARQGLNEPRPNLANAFTSFNAATDNALIDNMSDVTDARTRALRMLLSEPAVARVVAEDEDGNRRVYFVSRATPHRSPSDGSYAVSYNAMPLGRLAAMKIGGEVDAPSRSGPVTLSTRRQREIEMAHAIAVPAHVQIERIAEACWIFPFGEQWLWKLDDGLGRRSSS